MHCLTFYTLLTVTLSLWQGLLNDLLGAPNRVDLYRDERGALWDHLVSILDTALRIMDWFVPAVTVFQSLCQDTQKKRFTGIITGSLIKCYAAKMWVYASKVLPLDFCSGEKDKTKTIVLNTVLKTSDRTAIQRTRCLFFWEILLLCSLLIYKIGRAIYIIL